MQPHKAPNILRAFALAFALAMPMLTLTRNVSAAPPVTGAIFTTDATCAGTNINIFASKDAVYLDGGPAHPNAAGLPDGEYYCQVTEPNGAPLGTSLGTADETPITVTGGDFAQCYQLSAILRKISDSSPGYDDTTNPAGEYKVWVSPVSTFDNSSTKTDNFKVRCDDCGGSAPQGAITVIKFYDVNANGINDDGQLITGWKARIQDEIDFIRFTPVSIQVFAPDTYTVTESSPIETSWVHTTPVIVVFSLGLNETKNVEFGNLCLGAGGGLTLGFWSNKNGENTIKNCGNLGGTSGAMTFLSGLNLRNANGSNFDPPGYSQFRTWILGANATNMANMLSAQLAAMELNVRCGGVNGNSLIYAPGATSANSLGFATVNAVMAEANAELGAHGATVSGSAFRAYQEALKNSMDKANNNLNFVQATPSPFTFQ